MMPHLPDLASIFTALGWAVIHFIWQGALVGLVAAVLLSALKEASAGARYAVGCAALLCCLLAFIVTFELMLPRGVAASPPLADIDQVDTFLQASQPPSPFIAFAAWLWIVGVTLCSGRFLMQWAAMHRLRTVSISEVEPHWRRAFESLREDFGVSRAVRLVRSGLAEAPMVVGWLSPIVLVPASAFTSLTPDQLRSILAHELSHIRRCDHLANAAQIVIETILFFHPAVWWLSRQVRLERENCCDDAAVRKTGNPKILAEALAQLESLRITHPRAALAANGGPLMNRISRILGKHASIRTNSPRWPGVAALAAAAVMTAAGLAQATSLRTTAEPPTEAEIDAYLQAVIAKIQEGIDSGQITTDEANVKLESLRSHLDRQAKVADHFDAISAQLKGAQAGSASSRDAKVKLEAARSMNVDQAEAVRDMRALAAELHAAVAAGLLSHEEAGARLGALHKAQGEGSAFDPQVHVLATDLHAAVQAGRLAPAEAELALTQVHRARAMQERLAAEYEAMAAHLHAAVQAGEIKPEEAEAKLTSMHRAIADEATAASGADEAFHSLDTTVRAARLSSSAQAESELTSLHRRLVEGAAASHDADQAAKELHAAVLAGKLAPEAARDKLALIELAMAAQAHHGSQRGAAGMLDEAAKAHARDAELAGSTVASRRKIAIEERDLHESMMSLLDQLRAEVGSGAMTIDQARAALDALKAELTEPQRP